MKGAEGFEGRAKVPWGEKITYKFVVDGQWVTDNAQPTEWDNAGNLNNVYTAPAKPEPQPEPEAEPASEPTPAPAPAAAAEPAPTVNGIEKHEADVVCCCRSRLSISR